MDLTECIQETLAAEAMLEAVRLWEVGTTVTTVIVRNRREGTMGKAMYHHKHTFYCITSQSVV
jgi:hypothetical protein